MHPRDLRYRYWQLNHRLYQQGAISLGQYRVNQKEIWLGLWDDWEG